jgi:dipeptidyl-peptidase-4
VFDPRLDPSGRRVAFVHDRALHLLELSTGRVERVAGELDPHVSWGLADFVAAEEMDRSRGYWWSPAGDALLAARVDESPVDELWIADPANPAAPARPVRYPRAGTANAETQVYVIPLSRPETRVPVIWDAQAHPYLASAHWDDRGPMISVQSRDQRRLLTLAIDPGTGQTTAIQEQSDPDWVDLVTGVPRRLADGRLVTVGRAEDAPALLIDGLPVTHPSFEVRHVVTVDGDEVIFTANNVATPYEAHVWRWQDGSDLACLTDRTQASVNTAVAGGGLCLIGSASDDHAGTRWALGGHVFASQAEIPRVAPRVRSLGLGTRGINAGLLLPANHEPGTPLPVLLDPYGGPHFQRVMAARNLWLESQWLADQGFAVLVADGRGTPGRGLEWARSVRGDLASSALADQVDALQEAALVEPDLDLSRVAIRGWSFGGYLAALAVLRRPDVFHAAVAGAPVTDWRLYDTHYTERYLGTDPQGADREAYERSSILEDAKQLERPLLLIHGLADDNVLVAHTLQFSQRLTEAGRPHGVLPLTGITHMTPQELVAENLLRLQVEFLSSALRDPSPG